MNAIVGGKEERPVNIGQIAWVGSRAARVNIFDRDRACRRAIAFPQFGTGDSIVSNEEKRAAHGRQIRAECSRTKVLDDTGARGGAIALPKLLADRATFHDEK